MFLAATYRDIVSSFPGVWAFMIFDFSITHSSHQNLHKKTQNIRWSKGVSNGPKISKQDWHRREWWRQRLNRCDLVVLKLSWKKWICCGMTRGWLVGSDFFSGMFFLFFLSACVLLMCLAWPKHALKCVAIHRKKRPQQIIPKVLVESTEGQVVGFHPFQQNGPLRRPYLELRAPMAMMALKMGEVMSLHL